MTPRSTVSLAMQEKLNTAIHEVAQTAWLYSRASGKDFTRNRKLPLETMLRLLCGMGGNSLNKELFDYFKEREKHVTASAFVQQRGKLLPHACAYVFHAFNELCNDTRTLKGYHLYAFDGSDVNLAKNEESETYIEPKNGVGGYNQFHVNALYDLLNRTYKDVLVQPRPLIDERKAAISMLKRSCLTEKDVLTADRGYAGYNFFEHINRAGVKYAVRVKDKEWTEIAALPEEAFDRDMSVELRTTQTNEDKVAYAEGRAKFIIGQSRYGKDKKDVAWDFESPFVFHYRCVRFSIGEGKWEMLVTNLGRDEFTPEDLKDLYHRRWGIETSFRELKYAIGLVNFHARKEDYVLQEIYARMTMYNFCERITSAVVDMAATSKAGDTRKTKHEYQVNYTMAIHVCVDFFRCHDLNGPPKDVERQVLQYVLPVRPGRQDKRKVKPKSCVYFLYRVA